MRLVCWNVNGLRTLRSYAPWDGLPTLEACLEALQADIACFQEVKMTHRQLTYATVSYTHLTLPTSDLV